MHLPDILKHILVFLYVNVKQVVQRIMQYLRNKQNQMYPQTRILLGLGNPSKAYSNTRHNIGKTFISKFVKKYSLPVHKQTTKFTSFVYKDTVLALSQSYMNLSSQSLEALLKTYTNASLENSMLVVDDLDHKPGYASIKKTGSAEGHKGVLSVMNKWKTKDVNRLKIGIGRPEQRDPQIVSSYVLAKMDRDSMSMFESSIEKAIQLLRQEGYLV